VGWSTPKFEYLQVKVLKAFWQLLIIPTEGYKIPYHPKHNYVIDNDIVIVPKKNVM
jgi:hypothetical protein